ncbi:hypothetical protein LCGC14_2584260 [marine sediment metagenome]|uniref:Uncharacterized protein n=1 Tax=marine sediment metagenome TaxID=412755 RepID=A0A0F9ADF6_9ZZZZ
MRKRLLQLTDELWAAVDAARGDQPRNPWLEFQLWKSGAIRKAAKILGVKNPKRPADGRGQFQRKKATR